MRKALPGRAKAPKARTSGQSLLAADNHSLHAQTAKTAKLSRSTDEPGEVMTGNQGVKISDDQNSLKAGGRGPTLLEDFHRREKITHFDHERIPERVVHARGAAAHGVFQNTASVEDIPVIGPLAGPVAVPLKLTDRYGVFSARLSELKPTERDTTLRAFAIKDTSGPISKGRPRVCRD